MHQTFWQESTDKCALQTAVGLLDGQIDMWPPGPMPPHGPMPPQGVSPGRNVNFAGNHWGMPCIVGQS